MSWIRSDLDASYLKAFRDYLSGSGEAALQRANELSREALSHRLGLLEMSALHHSALWKVWEERYGSHVENLHTLQRAEIFLSEALSAYEMSHRGYQEANDTLRRLNQALEDEGKRIAHALHDESGQLLASVHIKLDAVAYKAPRPIPAKIRKVRELLTQIESHLRQLSHELCPPILDELGLLPALEFLALGVSKRRGLDIFVEDGFDARLPADVETVLYRVVQESLNNAVKHAGARAVRIRLQRKDALVRCAIHDDGKGFDPATVQGQGKNGGLGLRSMRERVNAVGGRLELDSAPSLGTQVSVTIPLEG